MRILKEQFIFKGVTKNSKIIPGWLQRKVLWFYHVEESCLTVQKTNFLNI